MHKHGISTNGEVQPVIKYRLRMQVIMPNGEEMWYHSSTYVSEEEYKKSEAISRLVETITQHSVKRFNFENVIVNLDNVACVDFRWEEIAIYENENE